MFDFIKKLIGISSGNIEYDLDTLQEIERIPIPNYKPLQGMGNPSNNIEYILQKRLLNTRKMEEWI